MDAEQDSPRLHGARNAWLVYTGLRLAVFLGTAGFFLIFGMNGFPLLIVALLVSSIVSLVVLRPQRAVLVAAQAARSEQRAAQRQAMRARLDEE
jgi:hypothetical protein